MLYLSREVSVERVTPEGWTEQRIALEALRAPIRTHGGASGGAQIVQRAGWYQVVTPSRPTPGANEVYLCEVDDADAERVIDETIAAQRALGLPWKWCVHPWTRPSDMATRLARRASQAWDARAMWIDSARDVPEPPDVEVLRLEGGDRARVAAVLAEGWETDPDETLADLIGAPPTNHHFLALHGGEPVGAASSIERGESTYLTAAVVLPAHRGRGAYRALVGARLRDARERGDALVTTQARDATSAPILERLGFATAFRMRCFTGT